MRLEAFRGTRSEPAARRTRSQKRSNGRGVVFKGHVSSRVAHGVVKARDEGERLKSLAAAVRAAFSAKNHVQYHLSAITRQGVASAHLTRQRSTEDSSSRPDTPNRVFPPATAIPSPQGADEASNFNGGESANIIQPLIGGNINQRHPFPSPCPLGLLTIEKES
jgi:hypothetical protein